MEKPSKKMIAQGINATIDINNCKYSVKQIAGWLNVEALAWVSEYAVNIKFGITILYMHTGV